MSAESAKTRDSGTPYLAAAFLAGEEDKLPDEPASGGEDRLFGKSHLREMEKFRALNPELSFELWDRAPDGTVTVTLHRTDSTGHALLPVASGHVYMVDAVAMLETAPEAPRNAVWHSLWAALTFEVP